MNRAWETHRGDEWWYQDYWCKASANRAAKIVCISFLQIAQGQLNQERLHEFLSISRDRFKGETILLNVSEANVLENLLGLTERGNVELEKHFPTYSKEAKIIAVKPYERLQVQAPMLKKKWWQRW